MAAISDTPDIDAQRILLHVLGRYQASWLWARPEDVLSHQQQDQFAHLMSERLSGKPLAYILGAWEFYGRQFIVNANVLIPRPSTEELVEQALVFIKKKYAADNRPLVIADIGTGTGCIAITLLKECEPRILTWPHKNAGLIWAGMNHELRIIATDISEAALTVAQQNAELHGVAHNIEFRRGNMLEPLVGRHVDLIVSNPPYVPSPALARAASDPATVGLTFEPRQALDGGIDGQKYIKEIKKAGCPIVLETTGGRVAKIYSQAVGSKPISRWMPASMISSKA